MSKRLLCHGGQIKQAAATFNIPVADWLDLSTGINPNGWPVQPVPDKLWQSLPQEDDDLLAVASDYYGTTHLLAAAGSQPLIQLLPQLLTSTYRVAVPELGYAEHRHAWQRHGHHLIAYAHDRAIEQLDHLIKHNGVDVVVVINPNNPTACTLPQDQLLRWRQQLATRDGLLIVDEAFIDATPSASLVPCVPEKGLIVLRSMGKFFGLAGMRMGFAAAEPAILEALRFHLGPWPVSGPTQWQATQALADREWQRGTQLCLPSQAQALKQLVQAELGLCGSVKGTALFASVTIPFEDAERIYFSMARQGVLLRLFRYRQTQGLLRVGLPKDEVEASRLSQALRKSCTAVDEASFYSCQPFSMM